MSGALILQLLPRGHLQIAWLLWGLCLQPLRTVYNCIFLKLLPVGLASSQPESR